MGQEPGKTPEKRSADSEEEYGALDRAARRDESALPGVREMLDERPQEYLDLGDLARLTQRSQIAHITGKDLLFRELLTRKAEALREEVAGPNPSPLERLLAERVVMCWLQLYYAELKYTEDEWANTSWTQEEWHQKRIDRLQRRYTAAIKSLAQVRRLLGVQVQVNIAGQQIVHNEK